jgi:hypothetical protein
MKLAARRCAGAMFAMAFGAGCVAPVAMDGIGHRALAPGMQPVCHEHVDAFGDEHTPGASIEWRSYASAQPSGAVVHFYEKQFGKPPVPGASGHLEWRPEEGVIYAIVARHENARWARCTQSPFDIQTVLLVSRMGSGAR